MARTDEALGRRRTLETPRREVDNFSSALFLSSSTRGVYWGKQLSVAWRLHNEVFQTTGFSFKKIQEE